VPRASEPRAVGGGTHYDGKAALRRRESRLALSPAWILPTAWVFLFRAGCQSIILAGIMMQGYPAISTTISFAFVGIKVRV
jgi:hypothetical protein